jgi:hypothetical protein
MPKAKTRTAYVLRISLTRIRPEIWRGVLVPSSITLKRLHLVLQTVMGWWNYHLYQFETPEGIFGTPDPDYPDETMSDARVRLDRFLTKPRDRIRYEYDFGDGWQHEIRLERIIGPVHEAIDVECLGGARACPPEDVGGPYGYAEFLEAMQDRGHPEHDRMVEWIGGRFDPEKFDVEAINRALMPRRRRV